MKPDRRTALDQCQTLDDMLRWADGDEDALLSAQDELETQMKLIGSAVPPPYQTYKLIELALYRYKHPLNKTPTDIDGSIVVQFYGGCVDGMLRQIPANVYRFRIARPPALPMRLWTATTIPQTPMDEIPEEEYRLETHVDQIMRTYEKRMVLK